MKIEKVWFDDDYVFIRTDVGHVVGNPIKWFKRLLNASESQRAQFEISPFGIHWPLIDEDLSLEGFFKYKTGEDDTVSESPTGASQLVK